MHVAITPVIQKLIRRRMKAGHYATPEDVLTAALNSLAQDETASEFEAGELDLLLREGENSGDSLDGDQVLAELAQLRDQAARGKA